jgi:cytochrome c551/c552
MRKILPLLLLMIAFVLVSFTQTSVNQPLIDNDSINTNGKELVNQKGCTLCHHPEKEIVGPSFKQVAAAYKGDKEKLLSFFNGQEKSIVKPEEFQYMKPVLNQLKKMKPEEREAIAAYIAGLK